MSKPRLRSAEERASEPSDDDGSGLHWASKDAYYDSWDSDPDQVND
jgi:hypothetical protein